MPVAIPAVIAGVAAGLGGGATILGIAFTAFEVGLLVGGATLALGLLSEALTPTPSAPSLQSPITRSQELTANVRQPITPWRISYGEARLGGPITFQKVADDTSGNVNQNLHMLLTVDSHQIDSIGTFWYDEAPMRWSEPEDNWSVDWKDTNTITSLVPGHGQAEASATFTVNTGTDVLTISSDLNLLTGDPCYVSSTTTLPAGLDVAPQHYHWIRDSSTTGRLTKTREQALAGVSVIDITSTGSGTHTLHVDADYQVHEQLRNGNRKISFFDGGVGSSLWSTNHKQSGHAKLAIMFSWNQGFFNDQRRIPTVTALVRGRRVFDPRDSDTKWTHNPALCIRDYMIDTEVGLSIPSSEIDDTALATAANVCEEQVSTEFSRTFTVDTGTDIATLSSSASGAKTGNKVRVSTTGTLPNPLAADTDYFWISSTSTTGLLATSEDNARAGTSIDITTTGSGTHTLTRVGVSTFTADATNDIITLTESIPHLRTGDIVQVETDNTLPGGLSASTNYYWSSLSTTGQDDDPPAPVYRGRLCTSYDNALAQTPVIDLTTAGTGTHSIFRKSEPRYTLNGAFNSEEEPKNVLNQMLAAMAGTLVKVGSSWIVYAGEYRSPTINIDENVLDGPISARFRASRREIFNGVKGTFTDPQALWEPTDFPRVTNSTYVTEDNGETIFKDIDLPFTISPSMAQRIAKIALERSRQNILVNMPCTLDAFEIQIADVINVTNTRFGWNLKPFEVTNWKLSLRNAETDNVGIGIDLTLRETASAAFDWNAGEETTEDPEPDTDLGDQLDPAEPTSLTLASGTTHLFIRNDGTIFSRIFVSWTAPADGYVILGGQIQIQHKLSSSGTWENDGIIDGAETSFYILDVQDSSDYDVRIRAINRFGIFSDWVTSSNHTVVGKTAPPSNVTSFSVLPNVNVVTFRWTAVSDKDLSGYILKYNDASITFDWDSAIEITTTTKGTLVTNAALPPGTWTVGIKAIDTSGNESTTEFTANVTVTNSQIPFTEIVGTARWPNRPHDFGRVNDTANVSKDLGALSDATTHIMDLQDP